MQCKEKSPLALLGKVFRLLVTGTEAPAYINTLSGCSTVGLGANHPQPIQFLPVMTAVSFDPFSVTLCLPSWYDFSLLCPLLLFPPKQTTQMRNSRYWWTDRLLITLYVKPSKHWALLYLTPFLLMEMPEPCFAMQHLQLQAASDLCDPQRGGQGLWLPVGNTDRPPSCPELCPVHSLPLTFTYQGVVVKPNKPPVPHLVTPKENAEGCWCTLRKIKIFCSGVSLCYSACQRIQLLEAGGFLHCSFLM